MITVARSWRICAAVLITVVAVSCEKQPAAPGIRTVSFQPANDGSFTVNITPNGSVPSHGQCTWTATVTGGVPSFHYAWKVNNSSVGTDSQFLTYTNAGSPFNIQVNVTDQAGGLANDSNVMSIGGTHCGS